ncbi:phasin [Rhizobium sp. CRIBSB]|nr:phasin [Rhizobium sp. CRIBSB]
MLRTSGEVIAARLEILRSGMADPPRADLAEIALMGAEKLKAAGNSAAVIAGAMGNIGERLSRDAADEIATAARAASTVAAASDPLAAAQAQYAYAVGWWGRAATQALRLNAELLQTQDAVMRPIHEAASANAERLKKVQAVRITPSTT